MDGNCKKEGKYSVYVSKYKNTEIGKDNNIIEDNNDIRV